MSSTRQRSSKRILQSDQSPIVLPKKQDAENAKKPVPELRSRRSNSPQKQDQPAKEVKENTNASSRNERRPPQASSRPPRLPHECNSTPVKTERSVGLSPPRRLTLNSVLATPIPTPSKPTPARLKSSPSPAIKLEVTSPQHSKNHTLSPTVYIKPKLTSAISVPKAKSTSSIGQNSIHIGKGASWTQYNQEYFPRKYDKITSLIPPPPFFYSTVDKSKENVVGKTRTRFITLPKTDFSMASATKKLKIDHHINPIVSEETLFKEKPKEIHLINYKDLNTGTDNSPKKKDKKNEKKYKSYDPNELYTGDYVKIASNHHSLQGQCFYIVKTIVNSFEGYSDPYLQKRVCSRLEKSYCIKQPNPIETNCKYKPKPEGSAIFDGDVVLIKPHYFCRKRFVNRFFFVRLVNRLQYLQYMSRKLQSTSSTSAKSQSRPSTNTPPSAPLTRSCRSPPKPPPGSPPKRPPEETSTNRPSPSSTRLPIKVSINKPSAVKSSATNNTIGASSSPTRITRSSALINDTRLTRTRSDVGHADRVSTTLSVTRSKRIKTEEESSDHAKETDIKLVKVKKECTSNSEEETGNSSESIPCVSSSGHFILQLQLYATKSLDKFIETINLEDCYVKFYHAPTIDRNLNPGYSDSNYCVETEEVKKKRKERPKRERSKATENEIEEEIEIVDEENLLIDSYRSDPFGFRMTLMMGEDEIGENYRKKNGIKRKLHPNNNNSSSSSNNDNSSNNMKRKIKKKELKIDAKENRTSDKNSKTENYQRKSTKIDNFDTFSDNFEYLLNQQANETVDDSVLISRTLYDPFDMIYSYLLDYERDVLCYYKGEESEDETEGMEQWRASGEFSYKRHQRERDFAETAEPEVDLDTACFMQSIEPQLPIRPDPLSHHADDVSPMTHTIHSIDAFVKQLNEIREILEGGSNAASVKKDLKDAVDRISGYHMEERLSEMKPLYTTLFSVLIEKMEKSEKLNDFMFYRSVIEQLSTHGNHSLICIGLQSLMETILTKLKHLISESSDYDPTLFHQIYILVDILKVILFSGCELNTRESCTDVSKLPEWINKYFEILQLIWNCDVKFLETKLAVLFAMYSMMVDVPLTEIVFKTLKKESCCSKYKCRGLRCRTQIVAGQRTSSTPMKFSSANIPPPIAEQQDNAKNPKFSLNSNIFEQQNEANRFDLKLSDENFSKEICEILASRIDMHDVEIKPDGLIYLPEIKYRRVLNKAFGPGGWVLVPQGPAQPINGNMTREYAMFVFGKFVSMAVGEQQMMSGGMTEASAMEAAKSNAMMRCCKDLGIASELWDPIFIKEFKNKYCVQVWCQHVKSKEKRLLWKRKDRGSVEYPFKEMQGKQITISEAEDMSAESGSWMSMSDNATEKPLQPSSSQTSSPQQSAATSSVSSSSAASNLSSSNSNTEEFSLSQKLPPSLKKYAGKSWKQVLESGEAGLSYVEWISKQSGSFSENARKALDWYHQNQKSQKSPL